MVVIESIGSTGTYHCHCYMPPFPLPSPHRQVIGIMSEASLADLRRKKSEHDVRFSLEAPVLVIEDGFVQRLYL
jgi:hypothetical protein